jgi:DNA primase
MKQPLSPDINRQVIKLLGFKSNGSFDHKSSATFFCPFHKDDTPSFSVNFDKGICNCFGCKKSGTIRSICFQMTGKTAENLLGLTSSNFRLTSSYNSKFSLETKIKEDEALEEKSSLIIKGAILEYYQSPEALEYIFYRGIEKREATSMQMKYTPEAYCSGTYFNKRLLIPIYNRTGSLINVEARDVTRNHKIKCLYPKDTIKTIYQHHSLNKDEPLFIVEGLMDLAVLRSDDYFKNSSTIFGTQVTEYQITLLNQFKEIILIPDNDEAGEQSVKDLKRRLKTKFSFLSIGPHFIKDIGDIPSKFRSSVKEFREAGNLILNN